MQSFVITSANCFLFCRDGVDENFNALDRYNRVKQQRNLMRRDLSFLIYPWGDRTKSRDSSVQNMTGSGEIPELRHKETSKLCSRSRDTLYSITRATPTPLELLRLSRMNANSSRNGERYAKGLGLYTVLRKSRVGNSKKDRSTCE